MKTTLLLIYIALFFSCDMQENLPFYRQENHPDNAVIYRDKGKIVGYLKCADNEVKDTLFGIFIISNRKDSLVSFNIPSSVHGLSTDQLDYGVYFFSGDSVLFEYKHANRRKKQFDCPPSTMQNPTFFSIDNFSQVVITDITNTSVYPADVDIINITVLPVDPLTVIRIIPPNCWNPQIVRPHVLYIINSTEELFTYLSCNNDIPEINFDKYSLLVARGGATSNINDVHGALQQISTNKYKWMIDANVGYATVPGIWIVAILTPKLLNSAAIELDINYY